MGIIRGKYRSHVMLGVLVAGVALFWWYRQTHFFPITVDGAEAIGVEAVRRQDPDMCLHIVSVDPLPGPTGGDLRRSCLKIVLGQMADAGLCAEFADAIHPADCFRAIALWTLDEAYCTRIELPKLEAECLEDVRKEQPIQDMIRNAQSANGERTQ